MKLSKGKQEIADFCDKHNACYEVREWAMTRRNMHDVWMNAKYDWMLWIIIRNVLGDRDSRLFACWCARNTPIGGGKTTWDMMPSEESRNAVIISERYAIGEVSASELSAAWSAARSAEDAARSAAGAAWSAARSAEDAARSAAGSAWSAARSAEDAAWSAASAARSAARSAAGAAWSAARSAAGAARSAAWSAAGSAWSAARSAEDAAWSAAGAAWSAASAAQLKHLRKTYSPFKVVKK